MTDFKDFLTITKNFPAMTYWDTLSSRTGMTDKQLIAVLCLSVAVLFCTVLLLLVQLWRYARYRVTPLYRLARMGGSQHLLTADGDEAAALQSAGWTREGIAGYVLAKK